MGWCFNPETYQINNIGDDEAIVFDFGKVAEFKSITIAETALLEDRYEIYGANVDLTGVTSGGLGSLTGIGSVLLASGQTSEDPFVIALTGAYRYMIATVPGGRGDGYRVTSISVVAAPIGLLLIASAFGLACLVRRRAA